MVMKIIQNATQNIGITFLKILINARYKAFKFQHKTWISSSTATDHFYDIDTDRVI